MPFTCDHYFLARRSRVEPAPTAVVAHVIHAHIIVDHGLVVGVVNDGGVHIVDRGVVGEPIMFPASTFIAMPDVAAAVVHAAVESNMLAPVTDVEQKYAFVPAPVTRRPEHTDLRRIQPRAGHPEVAFPAVPPIARSPQIAGLRARRLVVDRQRRRRFGHAYVDIESGRGRFGLAGRPIVLRH